VDYVKVKPIEFKPTPSDNGHQLEVELRIKVLTSQHEDMLFKVKIQGFIPITQEEVACLAIITPTIKVISKPEQLKKRTPTKKRTLTDMLVETISRIERKQDDQQKLIEKLIVNQNNQSINQTPAPQPEKRYRTEEPLDNLNFSWEELQLTNLSEKSEKKGSEFDEVFANLLKVYNNMKPEDKAEGVRKLIRNSSTRDTERISELLDLMWTEGLQKEPPVSSRESPTHTCSSGNCSCNPKGDNCTCGDCPHKLELERIEEFYKEFLSSGVNVPGF